MRPRFLFGDIVVVDNNLIGVVVKSWGPVMRSGVQTDIFEHEVYVRDYNGVKTYSEEEMDRYRVRHKYLDEEEMEYQNG